MGFKIGDRVQVVGNISSELVEGIETTITDIREAGEYPYELEGYFEHVQEGEIRIVQGALW